MVVQEGLLTHNISVVILRNARPFHSSIAKEQLGSEWNSNIPSISTSLLYTTSVTAYKCSTFDFSVKTIISISQTINNNIKMTWELTKITATSGTHDSCCPQCENCEAGDRNGIVHHTTKTECKKGAYCSIPGVAHIWLNQCAENPRQEHTDEFWHPTHA